MGLPGVGLLLRLISFLVASFLLVHLMALFGVFIVIAYPLWWLLAPRQTICFYCRAADEGKECPFCRKKVDKKNGVFPETFLSAILNGAVILIFSLFSIGFVTVESKLLFNSGLLNPGKTAFFLTSNKSEYYMNDTFPFRIELDGLSKPINTLRADLGFDPEVLEVSDISTQDSFASVVVEKEINNPGGYLRLTGGAPNPGALGPKVFLGTVTFKAKKAGVTIVRYLPSSLALANDGNGTNMLNGLSSAKFLILPGESPKEKKDRKTIELSSSVLGESATGENKTESRAQLYLLPENQGKGGQVLGVRDGVVVDKPESWGTKILLLPVSVLKWWNEIVLGFWSHVLGLVK